MMTVLRMLYTLLMFLALPIAILRHFYKSINFPAYRYRISERLGCFKNLDVQTNGILIHAVSVGEVVLTAPLIKALKLQYPNAITLTTMTPTGSIRVQQDYKDIAHVYMPYDLPWFINNLLNKVKPRCLVIMETEIWPNLIFACKKRNIPIVIANGRISDNSIGRYRLIKFFIAKVLKQISFITAQSTLDGERFVELGLPRERLIVAGNIKFDADINTELATQGKALKDTFGTRLVFVASSTHHGEEEQVLEAFSIAKQKYPNLLLVLIPRHPDRFALVAQLLTNRNYQFVTRSSKLPCTPDIDVILGDSMGEMALYYALADVAFVGGSLVPVGGHNMLEPALQGIATLTGPYYFNFKDITKLLQKVHGLQIVQNAEELAVQIEYLIEDSDMRKRFGQNAQNAVLQNRGAAQKVLDLLQTLNN